MLNIRFKTLNFVQFSWDAVFFFFTVAYLQIYNPYYTHRHHYLWKSWGCFVHFFFMVYSLYFLLLWSFYCGFTFNIFIHIVYKIQGLNLLVIAGTYVISFAALDYWLKPNEYFILWGKEHIYIFYCLSFSYSRCCWWIKSWISLSSLPTWRKNHHVQPALLLLRQQM